MDFRINIITLFLLFTAGLVLSASAKQSGGSRSAKKKGGRPKLSPNISENPFLQDHFTTTNAPEVTYQGNPFLSNTPKHPLYGNGSEYNVNNEPQNVQEDQEVNVAIYIHNPFLQPNAANRPANTLLPNVPRINVTDKPRVVKEPPVSGSVPIIPDVDTGTRTKSDLKCEEYGRQVSGTAEILSLVGANSGVTKVEVDSCGTVNRLVIGGSEASPGEYPHMVALGTRNAEEGFTFQCGGTLISPEWVLTAAHCTYGPNGSPTVARMGLNDLTSNQSGISVNIKTIIRHPTYKPPAMYADIALMRLGAAVTFNDLVKPACLYQLYDMVPTQAWVSGWGVTEFAGDPSEKLQKALLDVVDNIACTIRHNSSTAVPHGITPSMICAGDPRGGWTKDTCQGDSGGPLQVIHPKYSCLHQIIGITSFGQGCAIVGSPGVYTRVSHYLNWIEDIVWPDV